MSSRSLHILLYCALLVSACSHQSVNDIVADNGMAIRDVPGEGFSHLVVERSAIPESNELHVYIEGDGIPWAGNLPAADPTPMNKLALRLAALDDQDVAYVGRPCYFGRAQSEGCHPRYWTSHRYGEEVLASMAEAITEVRQPRHRSIVLIGHSGGGTLAVLLAPRIEDVSGVVSIAANLDIDAWADHHNYDRLTGSLNPNSQPTDSAIPHEQMVGLRDQSVPVDTVSSYAEERPSVNFTVFEDFDHICCWERDWPAILETVAKGAP